MLTSNNGILTQVQTAKKETEEAEREKENILNNYEKTIKKYKYAYPILSWQ